MAKRGAVTELNHDNWDQEEESEEAGEFKKATDDQMKVCSTIRELQYYVYMCFLHCREG